METKTETRVRYVFDEPYLNITGANAQIHTHTDDGWNSGTPDGAANYPWLMDNCIVWVESRTVTEFFLGETRVVVETPWVAEEEPDVNIPWLAHELKLLGQHEQVKLMHNPWSFGCIKRLHTEPTRAGALCYICDFQNIRDYENKMEREKHV